MPAGPDQRDWRARAVGSHWDRTVSANRLIPRNSTCARRPISGTYSRSGRRRSSGSRIDFVCAAARRTVTAASSSRPDAMRRSSIRSAATSILVRNAWPRRPILDSFAGDRAVIRLGRPGASALLHHRLDGSALQQRHDGAVTQPAALTDPMSGVRTAAAAEGRSPVGIRTDPEGLSSRVHAYIASAAFLVTVLVLALCIQLAHLAALSHTLWFDNLDLDPRYFDQWGQRIAAGDWLGDDTFFVDPLYPYVLGGLYALFGHDLWIVRLVQVGADVATVYLTARIGTAVASKAVGHLAALAYALYAPAVMAAGEIEKPRPARSCWPSRSCSCSRAAALRWPLPGCASGSRH